MGVLPSYIHVHHMYTWCSQRSEEGAGSLSTEVTCGCETPCRCWGWNLGHLQEQQMTLTTPAPVPLTLLNSIPQYVLRHFVALFAKAAQIYGSLLFTGFFWFCNKYNTSYIKWTRKGSHFLWFLTKARNRISSCFPYVFGKVFIFRRFPRGPDLPTI